MYQITQYLLTIAILNLPGIKHLLGLMGLKEMTMIFISALFIFIGFYSLYHTSKKATLGNAPISLWLQEHPTLSKIMGTVLLLLGHVFSIMAYGIGAGMFYAVILLMTIGSLIIILFPLFTKTKSNARKS